MMMVMIRPSCLEKSNETDHEDGSEKGNKRIGTEANYMRVKRKTDRVFLYAMNYFNSFLFVKMTGIFAEELKNRFLNI